MQTTLANFINANRLTMKVDWAGSNPVLDSNDIWARAATHWKCTVHCRKRRMTIYFSQGSAHTSEPKLADVLNCVASDASGFENARSFEDWAAEYGYDTDSRKAERTWRAVERQTAKLKALLNPDAYKQLLWHTDRL